MPIFINRARSQAQNLNSFPVKSLYLYKNAETGSARLRPQPALLFPLKL